MVLSKASSFHVFYMLRNELGKVLSLIFCSQILAKERLPVRVYWHTLCQWRMLKNVLVFSFSCFF